jgi:hypothetical protein
MRPSAVLAAALALPLNAAAAHAEQIGWFYAWSTTTAAVPGDQGNSGEVIFTAHPGSTSGGTSTITAAAVSTLSDAPASNLDTFTGEKYNLSLTLTDPASGKSGTLTFTGKLFGTLGQGSANITSTFDSPTTQTLVLGNDTFKVTIGPFTPPGPPSATQSGAISATVVPSAGGTTPATPPPTSTPSTPPSTPTPPPPSQAPEPTSLLLAGLGAAGVFVARRRR